MFLFADRYDRRASDANSIGLVNEVHNWGGQTAYILYMYSTPLYNKSKAQTEITGNVKERSISCRTTFTTTVWNSRS